MSGACHDRLDGGVEYELSCDGCGALFRCGDDSYFSWPVLCSAAEAEGWGVAPDLGGEHRCGECVISPERRPGAQDRLVPA